MRVNHWTFLIRKNRPGFLPDHVEWPEKWTLINVNSLRRIQPFVDWARWLRQDWPLFPSHCRDECTQWQKCTRTLARLAYASFLSISYKEIVSSLHVGVNIGLLAEFLLISRQCSSQDGCRAAAGAAAATGSADAVTVVRLILNVDITRRTIAVPSRPPSTHHLSTTAKVPASRGR